MSEVVFTLKQLTALRKLRLEMPSVLSEIAVGFFKDTFRNQGFTDKTFVPWEPRKGERSRFTADGEKIRFKKKDPESRNVLIKSGALRRSITRIPGVIGVRSALPYSAVHNEGGRAGRGKGFQMTQRQHIGESETLMNQLERRILDDLDKAFSTS